MKVYPVRYMNADSWSGITYIESIFTTEELAVQYIMDKSDFSKQERKVDVSYAHYGIDSKVRVVRDFTYYRVEEWEIQ